MGTGVVALCQNTTWTLIKHTFVKISLAFLFLTGPRTLATKQRTLTQKTTTNQKVPKNEASVSFKNIDLKLFGYFQR